MARVRWGNIVAIGRTRSVQEIQTCCVVKLTSGERETIPTLGMLKMMDVVWLNEAQREIAGL